MAVTHIMCDGCICSDGGNGSIHSSHSNGGNGCNDNDGGNGSDEHGAMNYITHNYMTGYFIMYDYCMRSHDQ